MLEAGARRILDLLDGPVLSPRRGTRLLDQALEQAGLVQLPDGNPELRAFVRRSLHPILAEELGPRLADEVTGDLVAALSPALRGWATQPASPSSKRMNKVSIPPPPSMPPSVTPPSSVRGNGRKVLVVGRDRFGAASLARTLVGAGFKVTTAFEEDDLGTSLASDVFDAILCDELAANAFTSLLRDTVLEHDAVLLVSHCRDAHEIEEQLRAGGIPKVFGLPSGASSREIVLTLARCTA